MSTWIFPSNPANYDVDAEFIDYGKINWYQNQMITNIQPDDIVYIYFSTPIREIRWKCIIGKAKYYLREDDEDSFSYTQTEEFDNGPYVEVIPILNFTIHDKLDYSHLKQHGLKSRLMGSQKIDGELLDYIEAIEQIESDDDLYDKYFSSLSDDDIKKTAIKDSQKSTKTSMGTVSVYYRSPYIAQYAKLRAGGKCQLCGKEAPFQDKNGQPYLESHHVKWLSQGGNDSIDNVVALCPNCHRKMHIISDSQDIKILTDKAKQIL